MAQSEAGQAKSAMDNAAEASDSTGLFAGLMAELDAPPEQPVEDPTISKLMDRRAALESIAHLKAKIESMWGTPELDVFLSGLFVDSRDGARKGLPLDVAEELVFLVSVNKMLRAIDAAGRLKVTLAEARRLVEEGDQARLNVAQVAAARPAGLVYATRRDEAAEGFLVRLRQRLQVWVRSRSVLAFIVVAVALAIMWPRLSAFISAALQ